MSNLKNTAKLASGTLISQFVMFLAIPILAKVYSPAEFGSLANFTSIVAIIGVVNTLKYEQALYLVKLKKHKNSILFLCLVILTIFTIAVSITFFLINQFSNYFLDLHILWYLIPVVSLFIGLATLLSTYYTANANFGVNSVSKIVLSISTTGSQFLLRKFSSSGLMIGYSIGNFLTILPYLLTLKLGEKSFDYRRLIYFSRRFVNFPKYQSISGLANSVSSSIPIFLLTEFYAAETAGLYTFAHRVLFIPVTLISHSYRQTFIQSASQLKHNKTALKDYYSSSTIKLTLIGLIGFASLYFLSEQILKIFFDPEWSGAAFYLKTLCFWIFFLFINPPSTSCLILLEKQKFNVIYDILLIIFRVLALLVGYYLWNSSEVSLILFTGVGVVFNLLLIGYVNKQLKSL